MSSRLEGHDEFEALDRSERLDVFQVIIPYRVCLVCKIDKLYCLYILHMVHGYCRPYWAFNLYCCMYNAYLMVANV